MQDILTPLKKLNIHQSYIETRHCYIYIYLTDITKDLCNIQIQKYLANKKIIQNYAQMKYKWPVTAIKPLETNFLV